MSEHNPKVGLGDIVKPIAEARGIKMDDATRVIFNKLAAGLSRHMAKGVLHYKLGDAPEVEKEWDEDEPQRSAEAAP